MNAGDSPLSPEANERILRSTVRILIQSGVGSATVDAICEAAGVTETQFRERFSSPSDVFVAIVGALLDSHVGNVDATVQRRRSLTESMQIAMRAVWELVEQRIEDHHALYVMMLAQSGDPDLIQSMGFAVHQTYLHIAEAWLAEVGETHAISWDLPIQQLALLMQASLDGFILDYLATNDGAEIRQLLDILAFQLAQHGRRSAKNSPY